MNRPWFATALLGLALALPASALQLEVNRPTLCGLSARVVVAEPTDIETRWTADGDIERLVHLAVAEVVKGDPVDDLDLVLAGGRMGETTVWVEDVPNLLTDARYLLFLAPGADGRLGVIGGDQGAIRLATRGSLRGESQAAAVASVGRCDGQ